MSYSFWRPPTLAPVGACPPCPLATPLHCTSIVKKKHWWNPIAGEEWMETLRYGKRRGKGGGYKHGRKPRIPKPVPIAWNSPSEEVIGHWTPTGWGPGLYNYKLQCHNRFILWTTMWERSRYLNWTNHFAALLFLRRPSMGCHPDIL